MLLFLMPMEAKDGVDCGSGRPAGAWEAIVAVWMQVKTGVSPLVCRAGYTEAGSEQIMRCENLIR